jgi:hypothetical protein
MEGELTRTATKLVKRWARQREVELMADWELAQREEPLNWIPPLD